MRPRKYNPGFLPEDELVARFVVRQHELETLMSVVRENTGPVNQHLLVLGPRGFGKSTLALRAAAAIRRDPELSQRWFPIVYAEESYEVASVGEFWLEALLHLADATGDPRWERTWAELKRETDDRRLAARALGCLLDFADERQTRLMLVVENLDQLLGEQVPPDDAWALRATLLGEPRIMLLATAVHRFEGIDQPDQAMFDLFRRVEIPPLDARECDRVWASVTGARIGTRRAKAVRILCGGNPRMVVILASFARGRGLSELLGELDELIDDHTDYFRHNIESLHGQMRRVFLALAEIWKPAPARVIAESARLPVNETSSNLQRLLRQGRISVARVQGKNNYYQVSERLYNIYYLMRRRGAGEARVRALVDFIRHLFEPARRPELLLRIAGEASEMEDEGRGVHLGVLGEFLREHRRDEEILKQIVEGMPRELLAKEGPAGMRKALKSPEVLVQLLRREDGAAWLDEAAEALGPFKVSGGGMVPSLPKRGREAKVVLAEEIAKHPGAAFQHLIVAMMVLLAAERRESGHACLVRAATQESVSTMMGPVVARLMRDLGRPVDALNILAVALKREPENPQIRRETALTLLRMNRPDANQRALVLLQGLQESGEVDLELEAHLILCLARCGAREEAERRFSACESRLGDTRPEEEDAGFGEVLGEAVRLMSSGAPGEHELQRFLWITQRFPRSVGAWLSLGGALTAQGRLQEAMEVADRVLEMAPAWGLGRLLKALVLQDLGDRAAALSAMAEATRLSPSEWLVWKVRLELVLESAPDGLDTVVGELIEHRTLDERTRTVLVGLLFVKGPPRVWSPALEFLGHELSSNRTRGLRVHILGATSGPRAALEPTRQLLLDPSFLEKNTRWSERIALRLAAAGLVRETLELLESTPAGARMEPIVVALRQRLGEIVDAPVEVVEVAEEVNRRIDALAATGDLWRVDPFALVLPDEVDEPEEKGAS